MKLLAPTILAALACAGLAQAAPNPVQQASLTKTGVTLKLREGTLKVDIWDENVVRVRYLKGDAPFADKPSFAVTAKPGTAKWTHTKTADAEVLRTPKLSVSVNRKTGAVSFLDAAGNLYVREDADEARALKPKGAAFEASQKFALAAGEAIYGLGQHPSGLMDNRGATVHLQQLNTDVAVPVFVSSKGYGVFWDNASITDVRIPAEITGKPMQIASEYARDIDYYFFGGPELDNVIGGYRKLTGQAPMMARWTWGFWQSKERYETQKELLGVADEFRKRSIPLDAVIQDWQYWEAGQWGSHRFDPARFDNPKAMVDALHAKNVHSIISVWPRLDLKTENLAELEKINAIYPKVYKNVYPEGFGKWYDPFNPKGRQLYWSQINKNIGVLGFDGYWLDASEAELGGNWGEMRELTTGAGPGAEVLNAYPLLHTTAVHEGQRRDASEKRAFILTRSAFAGQQRNATVVWSGDIHGRWDVLRRQIPQGLNFVATGIPYWNTDIGGFFGGDPATPEYRELFTRWYQYGAFTPMFRVHGTGKAKEVWRFDDATQNILVKYNQLRYRLLPYIYSVSWMVTDQNYTMMRPLAMDFRQDKDALNIPDQYMFGPGIMVAPVVAQGADQRSVYLPGKTDWYDFHTGKRMNGGMRIAAEAKIDTLPLYVRAGSILPMGPVVQYAEEQTGKPLEIRIYRGANGTFALYDDAGDGYGYEKGQHAVIHFDWNDSAKTLSIGPVAGKYPNMPASRTFNLVFVDETNGAGASEAKKPHRLVTYTGQAVSIKAE
jgi:alpha-D-xyloside xylohydrolase